MDSMRRSRLITVFRWQCTAFAVWLIDPPVRSHELSVSSRSRRSASGTFSNGPSRRSISASASAGELSSSASGNRSASAATSTRPGGTVLRASTACS